MSKIVRKPDETYNKFLTRPSVAKPMTADNGFRL